MILFVSGRTDIIAYYSKWFINRLEAGYIDVRNPFYPKLVSRIMVDKIDAFLFCTKNPHPIIDYLPHIKKPIVFHVTLTPYLKDIEPNVPDKKQIIDDIKVISKIIGKEFVVVRYDPILINHKYTLDYHLKAFKKLCESLDGYIERIIISFVDDYKNVRKNSNILNIRELTDEDLEIIGKNFSMMAHNHHIKVQTCFEKRDLTEFGFIKGECMSKELAYKLTNKKFAKGKLRKGNLCNCVSMVDIGSYNSCLNKCKYCYANYEEDKIYQNYQLHDDNSSLLIGTLKEDDIIKEREG